MSRAGAAGGEIVEGRRDFARAAILVIELCRRELLLFSHELERDLYGSQEFTDALKRFLLSSERAHIWLLVNRSRMVKSRSTRLLELAQILSSRCLIREVADESRDAYQGEWLIADRRHCLVRRSPDALTATINLDAPATTHEFASRFDALWAPAPVARELYSLNL